MQKPIFKIIDQKGRVHLPKDLRLALKLSPGDIVDLTADKGRLAVKKAIVVEDRGAMPMEAKIAYAETVAREMDDNALTDLLELAVGLLQQRKIQS